MEGATDELRSLLNELARAVEWQAELGAYGVPRAAELAPDHRETREDREPPKAAAPEERGHLTREGPGASRPGAGDVRGSSRPDVVAPPTARPVAPLSAAERLKAVREELGECERCKLCTGRRHIVYGVGNPEADLMFVGEAPGRDEDLQGIPFVGRAGKLLTKMIAAMGLTRDDVYIANIIKCRPPRNRDPEPDEVVACEPFLLKQIDAISPKVLVSLGRVSAQTLLRVRTPISRLRGRWRDYHGVKLMPTFHPAYLLRSPDKKREAWADLQAVMAELGLDRPS